MAENPVSDVLGIAPYGEAMKVAITKSMEGIESFLSITCKPALEELGLLARDQVRVWRLNNILKVLNKAKDKFEYKDGSIELKANPKVVLEIFDNASKEENDELQEMWAGVFASACSTNNDSDDNLVYINILKQLNLPQVRIVKYMCENSKKGFEKGGKLVAQTISPHFEDLVSVTGINNIGYLEGYLNHISALRLSYRTNGMDRIGFFYFEQEGCYLTWLSPTMLALQLYVRAQGYRGNINDFWEVEKKLSK